MNTKHISKADYLPTIFGEVVCNIRLFAEHFRGVELESRLFADYFLLYTKNKTLEISLEGSKSLISLNFFGGTCGGRTHDKRIKSPLLYQLS